MSEASDHEATIEDRIEEMWDAPSNRRERWLGFFGKLVYEVGGVVLILVSIYGGVSLLAWVIGYTPSLETVVVGTLGPIALLLWVANKAFCNIIGR